ncbi:MAG: hypothetical protein J7J92_03910 [Candidatus Aenigmarchaeota archaeon]|nr:hypothetical protein [Candidatus Aenigmarchaeota archaeon]
MDYLCIRCKGKGLCGKPCKILKRIADSVQKVKSVKENFNSSLPSVFVGTYSYPNVNIGIVGPPVVDKNSWTMDSPDYWYKKRYEIQSVLETRYQLINSKKPGNIKPAKLDKKFLEVVQEVALAKRPVTSEIILSKRPKIVVSLDTRTAPIGSSAKLKKIVITENTKISSKIEYVVRDDLKAEEQLTKLYKLTDINQIQKIFSAGLLGTKTQKKIVPTRWSITATDDVISKNLIENIKKYPLINEYQIFENSYLGNYFLIILVPSLWSFEIMEFWKKNSVWNRRNEYFISQDYEAYFGRKNYASNVTGGYYAARLGVAEYLNKIKRQASVLILRKISDEYFIPLGVWVVRETVRGCFNKKAIKFKSLENVIKYTRKIPQWTEKSWLLRQLKQKTLKDY